MMGSISKLPDRLFFGDMYLRLLCMEDAADFYEMTNVPEIAGIISFLSYPVDPVFPEEWIKKNDGDTERVYGIFSGDRVIGCMGAHLNADLAEVEVGYWVSPEHMGRGVASAALGRLLTALKEESYPEYKIFAECLPDNHASLRVLAKCGFSVSGGEGKRTGRIRMEIM